MPTLKHWKGCDLRMKYVPFPGRYESIPYERCGNSGLLLSRLSLGLWHNFGSDSDFENCRDLVLGCFDRGITHFDLANNYGPPPGSAESVFGKILKLDLGDCRDELVISTKAGYHMWGGPYGEWGSRKHLFSSLEQSLKRIGLDYVDIFYHHRPDPNTPLEETARALSDIVLAGKALYIGISNYDVTQTEKISQLLAQSGTPCLIHQFKYSMLTRQNEELLPVLLDKGIGGIAFSPLAQGLLTGKYQKGIPSDSRAAGNSVFLKPESIKSGLLGVIDELGIIAKARNQNLAQLALSWILKEPAITSVIIGASKLSQVDDNLKSFDNLVFSDGESSTIDQILSKVLGNE